MWESGKPRELTGTLEFEASARAIVFEEVAVRIELEKQIQNIYF